MASTLPGTSPSRQVGHFCESGQQKQHKQRLVSSGQSNFTLHGSFPGQALQGKLPPCFGLSSELEFMQDMYIVKPRRTNRIEITLSAMTIQDHLRSSQVYKSDGWADSAWVNYVAVKKSGGTALFEFTFKRPCSGRIARCLWEAYCGSDAFVLLILKEVLYAVTLTCRKCAWKERLVESIHRFSQHPIIVVNFGQEAFC
jgi:hypothetical protein